MIRPLLIGMALAWVLHADGGVSSDYELDLYYSNTSLFFQIGDEPVVDATEVSEPALYTNLFLDSWKSNTFIMEAALYPAAIAGVAYRNGYPEAYEHALNKRIVQALTTGFEEPYALSLFFGRMVVFNRGSQEHIGSNRAYAGYLLSVGDRSIKENRLIENVWFNVEAKLKGTRDIDPHLLDWSFRVGAKFNRNSDVADSIYVGARRSRIDFFKHIWSWIYNSGFDIMVAVTADRLELMQVKTLFEKQWPIDKEKKFSFGLELGYIYESSDAYRGALYDEGVTNHRIILRPNITF